jgi:hypothetical protein
MRPIFRLWWKRDKVWPRQRGKPGEDMSRLPIIIFAFAAIANAASAQDRPTRFWNLTGATISEFYLAPASTANWGPNQCKNDKDGSVDPDERLRITGVPSGTYDAKFSDVTGRVCIVRDVKVEAGEVFSIEEKDLTSCHR